AACWQIRAAVLLKHIGRAHESEELYRQALAQWNKERYLSWGGAAASLNDLARYLATDVGPRPHIRDPGWPVARARKAVEWGPKNEFVWNTLGVAQYRAGDWKAAIATLDKSMALGWPKVTYNSLILALAHWRLGDKAQLRRWYHLADQWMGINRRNAPYT